MTADRDLKACVGVDVTVVAGVDLNGLGFRVGINIGPHFSVLNSGVQAKRNGPR